MKFQEFWLLAALWGIFYFIHSLLASESARSYLIRNGIRPPTYRLWYTIVTTSMFITILGFQATFPKVWIFNSTQWNRAIGLMLASGGLFLLKASFRVYPFKGFIGIVAEEPTLQTNGLLSKIRHPLYSSTLLLLVGYFLFNPQLSSLVFLLTTCLYLPIGIYLEEKKLIRLFGDAYLAYRREVPALIPRIRR